MVKSFNPRIRALSFNQEREKLLVGTRGGEIIEIDIRGSDHREILQSHFHKELWGLAVHPQDNEYVTVGEDFVLGKWSIDSRKVVQRVKMRF